MCERKAKMQERIEATMRVLLLVEAAPGTDTTAKPHQLSHQQEHNVLVQNAIIKRSVLAGSAFHPANHHVRHHIYNINPSEIPERCEITGAAGVHKRRPG